MPIKKARKLRDGLLIAGAVIMLCLPYIWIPFFYIGMAVSCFCLIVQFIFLRCPRCHVPYPSKHLVGIDFADVLLLQGFNLALTFLYIKGNYAEAFPAFRIIPVAKDAFLAVQPLKSQHVSLFFPSARHNVLHSIALKKYPARDSPSFMKDVRLMGDSMEKSPKTAIATVGCGIGRKKRWTDTAMSCIL